LPDDVHPSEYFGFDRMEIVPINSEWRGLLVPTFDVQTLEENATYKVIIDEDGAKKKVRKEHRRLSMDQWLKYPVKDRKTWREYKKRLNPHSPARYPLWWKEEKEVMSKVPYLLSSGGYFPCIDHSVPSDISFDNYLYYLELIRKLAH